MAFLLKLIKASLPHPLQQNQNSEPAGHTSDLPTPISPLLALPTELKLHIISYIFDKESEEPTLIILRHTHRIFRQLIPSVPYGPRSPYNSTLREVRKKRFLHAERKYPYLIPPRMLPCYQCLYVRHRLEFDRFDYLSTDKTLSIYGVGLLGGGRGKSLGCEDAQTRYCSRCVADIVGSRPESAAVTTRVSLRGLDNAAQLSPAELGTVRQNTSSSYTRLGIHD